MSQLTRRVGVALWGIPLLLLVVLLGGGFFTLFMMIVCCLAANEFYRLMEAKGTTSSIGIICGALLPLTAHFYPEGMVWLISLAILIIVLTLPSLRLENIRNQFGLAVAGAIYPALFLSFLVMIRDGAWEKHYHGAMALIFIISAIWICDTAAYFGGRAVGRRKLAPVVSPNKTWEGAICGILGALFWAVLAGQVVKPVLTVFECVIGALIVGTIGQLGDLAESALKRSMGMKDTGNILGPHGGILDRFDSMAAVAPVFFLFLKALGKI